MNIFDNDFPEVTEAYRGSLEDWLELFERYAFPRISNTETSTEMKRIFKRYTEVTYEDWLDRVIKCARDEIWYEEKINLSIREFYLVVRKYPRIEGKLKTIYNKFSTSNNILEPQYLQEAASSYIGTLRDAYNKGDLNNQLTINAVRRQYSGTHSFLTSQKFDPYFSYLTGIFKLNGNSRYRPATELPKKKNLNRRLDQTLDAHHIIFRSLDGEEKDLNNLIALFRDEHIEAHRLFVECLRDYLAEPEANVEKNLNLILVKAQKSLNIISGDKQDRASTDFLIDLLADDLIEEEDRNALITRINNINLMNHLAVYGQTSKVDSDNLRSKDKAEYLVTFTIDITEIPGLNETKIDPNNPKCATVYGVEGVQKIIYKVTGKEATEDWVKTHTSCPATSEKDVVITNEEGKPITNEEGEQIKRPRTVSGFANFNLASPLGIYKTTGNSSQHESKPIIYFRVNKDTYTPEYDSGQWVQSVNVLKDRGIGVPYKAYQRLDQTHDKLKLGLDLSSVFKGKIWVDDKGQRKRDFYTFMYADDIDLLQNIIDEKNKNENRVQKISLEVKKDGITWYPKAK